MKIGIVCYPTYGGSGVLATELGIALAKKGHSVHFITYKKPARLNTFYNNIYFHEVSSMSYPVFEFQPYETSLASKMIDVAIFEKLDIIHVHYAVPHAAVAFMAKQVLATKGISIPIVTTLHGTDITLVGSDRSFAPVVEFSINNSDIVTAVSNNLKEVTEQSFNITRDIKVIHNFIDLERFRRIEHKSFRKVFAPNDEKIIMHVSNFRKVKRIEDIVDAFKLIRKEMPAKLMLVGDGPERQSIAAHARKADICDDVKFLGKQDAVEELLSISDLFFLPSQHESFGLSALEAMACEVPVISSNIGGLPEVNIEDSTGYLLDVGDVKGMADKALTLLGDDVKLAKFRAQALEQAKRFSKSKIINQYENLYQELLVH